VFGTVDVRVATAADPDGSVPVTFRLTERKRHAVTLNAAYSSDLGGSGGITWSDRNLLGHAETLTLNASVINLNGSATNGAGYDTGALLTLPEFGHPQQSLQFSLTGIKQSLLAYDQIAETAGVTLTRNLSKLWSASVGFTSTIDKIYQPQELLITDKDTFYYTLFAVPLSLRYDSTDLSSPLLDATHGIRAALTITPTLSLGPPNATYVISQLRASTYFDLHDLSWTAPGRTVIAVRALYGYAQGANVIDLPPDQRFYAGGSGTVRGYRFQSVGPQFSTFCRPEAPPGSSLQVQSAYYQFCNPTGPEPPGAQNFGSNFSVSTPVGGVAVDSASVELRQRIGQNYGFALFADAGRVGQSALPFAGEISAGVGTGLRYYTPIGPLRVDFALPLRHSAFDDRFEIYIGLGQSF
jgi:translocation and assembly module TamA